MILMFVQLLRPAFFFRLQLVLLCSIAILFRITLLDDICGTLSQAERLRQMSEMEFLRVEYCFLLRRICAVETYEAAECVPS